MSTYARIPFSLIVLFMLVGHLCKCQTDNGQDSLLIYLKNIKGAEDTVNISAVFDWISRESAEGLTRKEIPAKIYSLETTLREVDFFSMLGSYQTQLNYFNSPATNDYAIEFAKDFVNKYKDKLNNNSKYHFYAILRNLRVPYRNSSHIYSGIEYFSNMSSEFLAKKDSNGVSTCYNVLGGFYHRLGIDDRSTYYMLKSVDFLDETQISKLPFTSGPVFGKAGKVNRYSVLGSFFLDDNKLVEAEKYLREAERKYLELDSPMYFFDGPYIYLQLARSKSLTNSDSSDFYFDLAKKSFEKYNLPPRMSIYYYQQKAVDFLNKNKLDSAEVYIRRVQSVKDSLQIPITNPFGDLIPYYYQSSIFLKRNQPLLAIPLLQKEIVELKKNNLRKRTVDELLLISEVYNAAGQEKEAFISLNEAFLLNLAIVRDENEARTVSYEIERKMMENENRIQQLDTLNETNRRVKFYLYGILSLLVVLAIVLWIFYSNKRKSNRELFSKNNELARAIEQLKATQSQLIHSEKMASLGAVTAGIAHEIQNPLNFVNNFSEVNKELIEEWNAEMQAGNLSRANELAADIKTNSEKIIGHGKRADGIVKSMLLHSRNGKGQKELTEINAFCDEYLRLSYHGMRAREKSFDARLTTVYDSNAGSLNIVPEEVGRVLLNLYNNAFYALAEHKRKKSDFQPELTVMTQRTNGKVEIMVKDNGEGIPKEMRDKIFQPFFTTKPTGQGTGLGLSLSYDIIKSHGGKLSLADHMKGGAAFVIELPAI